MPTLDRQDDVFVLASVDVDPDEVGKAHWPHAQVTAATGRFYSKAWTWSGWTIRMPLIRHPQGGARRACHHLLIGYGCVTARQGD
ncbi:hypothetical protein PV342_22640 [Streptomyces sp. PA03-3a]|nr:hypothetical protein [Streptomyces sp. PA03-3a]